MIKQYLHTLPIALMTRMHKQITRGYRSQFVEKAIETRLKGQNTFDLGDVDTLELLGELTYRRDVPVWFTNQIRLVRKEIDPEW